MVDARLLDDRTIYSRTGDVVAWLSVALLVAVVLPVRARRPASRRLICLRDGVRLDEQVRRYQDLVKRTSDLRSYL